MDATHLPGRDPDCDAALAPARHPTMNRHRLPWILRYLWRFYLDWLVMVALTVAAGYGLMALAAHVLVVP